MIVYTLVTLWLVGAVITSAIIMEKTKPDKLDITKMNFACVGWPITLIIYLFVLVVSKLK